ncbi:putative RING-H2 finger protein ATL69 [Tripterygium wilfordii]|uniref:Putative RING-H2 finger protein ATL69 n=1 Tax=Tripterygium wilfordii TaxID=458696 RepID=A0A7J7C5C9_TRIWF|nr:putative RING-H2 finger protein ATL69 [Tripterygium wilfordii]KAF5729341.1 putative RING-H2 finger protein ATL69 [Tripterygium wilfordii]
MSTAEPPVSTTAAAGVGLGYGIAIAVSILVLISTIMLASYVCVRLKGNSYGDSSSSGSGGGGSSGRNGRPIIMDNSTEPVVVVVGLDRPIIESFPKTILGESRRLPRPNNGPCSICLSEYRAKDTVRCVPECNHCFHADCIDKWLKMNATCPLCRSSPAPTPLGTPLSEIVPLPFHAR